ncbi:RNA polymerase subunit sigma [candidate division KSB1 bacterium]|nr:RNA polymerase sigma factor RpoD/SigA [bacterium]OQX59756.1 MAG: RNA polymerase subunit sigma [candidate division KSB1 bacterium 4484_219]RKY78073.1 MAG: RNA polymerase subunit sigma [candidate division KSB1 bacterium]HDI51183.1 RNA polymerase sigma factor RpoD/SigA [Bacteroidota bacterium]RKY84070.1 MAG: RNA polymerase subunit sigma [candidate division KSB1 bacterium]
MKQTMKYFSKITYKASLANYLQDIQKVSLLTPEEEVELAKRIRAGDQEALNRLVEANLRFVVSIAKEYQNRGLPLEDLINEGNIGLIKAAKKFDSTKGFRFISYAVWWIRQSITEAIVNHAKMVRLPFNKVWEVFRVEKTFNKLRRELGRDPSLEEVTEALGISHSDLSNIMVSLGKDLSLDEIISDDFDSSLLDFIADEKSPRPDASLLDESLKIEVEKVLSSLPWREGEILRLYYGINEERPLTLNEIGERLGLSRERVRQIKELALRKLRQTSKGKVLRQFLG